ncbi:MAG TPA: glycosyltransferase family 2 protein [Bryobacteraceae bacterium]|nr:glycosyltransferase family 2 protein [Bryobacteraceae bacterium]
MIGACLEALAKMAPEVAAIVVDNASADASVGRARREGAQVIANGGNRGFAAAVNQGFQATSADFVLLLNPDVCLTTPVDSLVRAAANCGLSAGKLTDATGRPQTGFTIRRLPTAASLSLELLGINRLWRNNPVNRRYRYLDRDLSQAGPVEQPAGAFLMLRRDVWEQLGGLDESFHPIWFEDVDFCRRALDAGYQIEYVPEVQAVHQGGHSVSQIPVGCRTRYWYGSLLRYAAKHLRPSEYRAVWLAAVLGAIPRMVAGMIRQKSLQPATAVVEIFRSSGRRKPSPAGQIRTGQDA